MKTYTYKKIRSQKNEIPQWNIDKRKIDGESRKLYGLAKKAADKRMNQISNFEEWEWEKSFKYT